MEPNSEISVPFFKFYNPFFRARCKKLAILLFLSPNPHTPSFLQLNLEFARSGKFSGRATIGARSENFPGWANFKFNCKKRAPQAFGPKKQLGSNLRHFSKWISGLKKVYLGGIFRCVIMTYYFGVKFEYYLCLCLFRVLFGASGLCYVLCYFEVKWSDTPALL